MFDNISLWNIAFIIINLIVLVVIMRIVAIKPIRNIIKKREDFINGKLSNAAASEASAKALETEWHDKMQGVEEESARLMEQAKTNADIEYNRLVKNAHSEADRIVENARKSMEEEHTKVMKGVQTEIAGLAIDITKKVLETSDLKDINDSLYEKFLTEAGDDDGSVGN
ncbi:MAG: F0F1 ATP synthase subunit B [Clostridiales bacterium]|nr:F0F1 ATP synthase subunit B [Clostridiales bacterium]